MDWFLYGKDIRHERVQLFHVNVPLVIPPENGELQVFYALKWVYKGKIQRRAPVLLRIG